MMSQIPLEVLELLPRIIRLPVGQRVLSTLPLTVWILSKLSQVSSQTNNGTFGILII